MKIFISILCFVIYSSLGAQEVFPQIFDSEVENPDTEDILMERILMIDAENGIILNDYGNADSEFEIITHNANTIIITFEQPSHNNPNTRCAAGTERGFIVFNINDKAEMTDYRRYLTESCLFSIEMVGKKMSDDNIVEYLCENFQSEKSYQLILNKDQCSISKKDLK